MPGELSPWSDPDARPLDDMADAMRRAVESFSTVREPFDLTAGAFRRAYRALYPGQLERGRQLVAKAGGTPPLDAEERARYWRMACTPFAMGLQPQASAVRMLLQSMNG